MIESTVSSNNVRPQKELDQPSQLPKSINRSWKSVRVRPRRRYLTRLQRFPRTEENRHRTTVYVGDVILISRILRYKNWIAVKVGHEMGWINTEDVKFTDIDERSPNKKRAKKFHPEYSALVKDRRQEHLKLLQHKRE